MTLILIITTHLLIIWYYHYITSSFNILNNIYINPLWLFSIKHSKLKDKTSYFNNHALNSWKTTSTNRICVESLILLFYMWNIYSYPCYFKFEIQRIWLQFIISLTINLSLLIPKIFIFHILYVKNNGHNLNYNIWYQHGQNLNYNMFCE